MALSGLSSVNGLAFFILTIIFLLLAISAVGLRFWVKNILRREYGAHDFLIVAALLFAVGYAVNSFISVDPGPTGLHLKETMQDLGPEAVVLALKVFFASAFIWITSTTFIKLSMLHLYVRIFQRRWFRYAAYCITLLSGLYWIGYILTGFLICRPLALNWNKTLKGHCGNTSTQEIASAAINMILDLAIVVLPMPVLWTLQMPLKSKLALSGVFSLGLCICAMNITRVILVAALDAEDFTYSFTYAGLFAGLEIYIGITTACLPTLGPLILRETFGHRGQANKPYNPETGPTTGTIKASDRIVDKGPFERLQDDEYLLREVAGSGCVESGRAVWADAPKDNAVSGNAPEGTINVQTDMDIFSSHV